MMLKAVEIIDCEPYYLVCRFNNGEVKKLFCEQVIRKENNKAIAHKLLDATIFKQEKIGAMGHVYWDKIAEMKDETGNTIICEYDLSPEFVYHNSMKL